jgi:hypothetical protein
MRLKVAVFAYDLFLDDFFNSAYASFVLIVATRPWKGFGKSKVFGKKNTTPQIYLRRRPKQGGDCFYKTVASRNAMEAQTLLLSKPVKNFATDKDE